MARNPIFLNSMPKAGTNLLSRACDLIGLKYSGLGVAPTLIYGRYSVLKKIRRGPRFYNQAVSIGLDVEARVDREWLAGQLQACVPGHYVTGHANFSRELVELLKTYRFQCIQILRDPRDVLLSYVRYVSSQSDHFLHNQYRDLTLNEGVCLALKGGRLGRFTVRPFGATYSRALEWNECVPETSVIRFEDLVGPKGGGNSISQRNVICHLANLFEMEVDEDYVIEKLFGRSRTFRKGMIGLWRDNLSQRTCEKVESELREIVEIYESGLTTS